jgi:hypothetical protein
MAEMATIKPLCLFDLKNHSSWLALEHNVFITINNKKHSAHHIKNEIVKKIQDDYLHPLIDFAFFMPKGGNLNLADVCFHNIYKLDCELTRMVNRDLLSKSHIKSEFSLIILPECLKQVLPHF